MNDNELFESILSKIIIDQLNSMDTQDVGTEKSLFLNPEFLAHVRLGFVKGLQWVLQEIYLKGRWQIEIKKEDVEFIKKMMKNEQ